MEEPTETPDSETELEARIDAAEVLQSEARQDGIKDVEREAEIDKLTSKGDLVEEVLKDHPVGAFRGERKPPDLKINPVRMEKGWYVKAEHTQRRILQKKIGSYRPEPTDPVNQKPHAKAVVEGRLFDPHPLSRVRKRDVEATGTIKAAVPAPLPVKPPPAPPPPAEGRCWECFKLIRRSGKNAVRAGTKFCTDNMGDCRKAYNNREAERAELIEFFKDWSDGRHGDRMLSIHRAAAEAMWASGHRCGIKEGTFTATPDGVLATHTKPLPPIEPQGRLQLEAGDGFTMHRMETIATATDTGTFFTFEIFSNWYGVSTSIPESPYRPESNAISVRLSFEGDPGVKYISEGFPTRVPLPRVPPLPPGAVMYAARNGRLAEFLADRKRDLAA